MISSRARAGTIAAVTAAIAIAGAALLPRWFRAPDTPAPPSSAPEPLPSTSDATSTGAGVTPEITTLEGDDTFRLLTFSVPLAGARIRAIDTHMTRDLATPLLESGASLVVNGGFFDQAQRPEGLVISEGALLSPLSDSLGGGVLSITQGRGALSPAEGFIPRPTPDFAIQARPRLVVGGASNISKDDGRAAERTALCLREGGSTLEIIVARGETAGRGPTLALLADMLVSRGCSEALNLDGGPSTGVAWRAAGGGDPMILPPRGPVRHGLAIWVAR